jgi:hypothetical protein
VLEKTLCTNSEQLIASLQFSALLVALNFAGSGAWQLSGECGW